MLRMFDYRTFKQIFEIFWIISENGFIARKNRRENQSIGIF